MNSIQDSIRRLIEQGKSQSWIARELKVSQPTISRWCAGEVSDAAEAGMRLAKLVERQSRRSRKPA